MKGDMRVADVFERLDRSFYRHLELHTSNHQSSG